VPLPTSRATSRPVRGHTCGNGCDGQGYCWGANNSGELGVGSSGPPWLNPTLVAHGPEVLGYKQLSAGDVHSCGIANTGKAYCWGLNGSGQLGDGTWRDQRARSRSPVRCRNCHPERSEGSLNEMF
jgi:alpha-tubulin suppressor-like RCC1 family protein